MNRTKCIDDVILAGSSWLNNDELEELRPVLLAYARDIGLERTCECVYAIFTSGFELARRQELNEAVVFSAIVDGMREAYIVRVAFEEQDRCECAEDSLAILLDELLSYIDSSYERVYKTGHLHIKTS